MTQTVLIGEAWGEKESQTQHPFVGPAGQELARLLHDAGFPCPHLPYKFTSPWTMRSYWQQVPLTLLNTFNSQPPANNVEAYYASLSEEIPVDKSFGFRKFGSAHKYVLSQHAHDITKLHNTLAELQPNLIIALGNTALWALGLPTKISQLRGHIAKTRWGKVLPCYHPAAVIRNWKHRHITVVDLFKARRESQTPDVSVQDRTIYIPETAAEAWAWWEERKHAPLLSIDIETERKTQISEFGVAVSPTEALWIPFLLKENGRYIRPFPFEQEVSLWKLVKEICESPTPKLGQNFKYDVYWLAHKMGIAVNNWIEDTMVKAHIWQPEMQKSLGFLGSLFLDEVSWKGIRKDSKGEE